MDPSQPSKKTLRSGTQNSMGSLTSTPSTKINERKDPIIIGNNFCVGMKIGEGNFGEVRYGRDLTTGNDVAIKFESRKSKSPQLHHEFSLYTKMGEQIGLPKVYYSGPSGYGDALVMELCGPNLEELFMSCRRNFTPKCVLMIAMQILRRFEFIHSKGIIFRDVKPENFVMGLQETTRNIVHIIDFGLAKMYYDFSSNEHIPFRDGKNLTGTARYMSLNTHMGLEQSRRDDLESLGYMCIYFLRGALPWQGLKGETTRERYRNIGQVKRSTSIETLCSDSFPEWISYFNYVKGLKFDESPDYNHMYNHFYNSCKQRALDVDFCFDWQHNSVAQQLFKKKTERAQLSPLLNNFMKEPTQRTETIKYQEARHSTNNFEARDLIIDSQMSLQCRTMKHSNLCQPMNIKKKLLLNDISTSSNTRRPSTYISHLRKPTPSHLEPQWRHHKASKFVERSSQNHLNDSKPDAWGIGTPKTISPSSERPSCSIWSAICSCCYKHKRPGSYDPNISNSYSQRHI